MNSTQQYEFTSTPTPAPTEPSTGIEVAYHAFYIIMFIIIIAGLYRLALCFRARPTDNRHAQPDDQQHLISTEHQTP